MKIKHKSYLRLMHPAFSLLLIFVFNYPALHAQGTDNFYGVMFSYGEDVSKAKPKLADLGIKWCRVWVNIKDWSTPSNNTGSAAYDNGYQQAIALKAAGYKVILEINSEKGKVPTYSQAKAVYNWMLQKPNLKTSVDVWEIFNELNLPEYYEYAFSTTLSYKDQALKYINGPLKAAWDVFHNNNGEKVLGGSWTLWQQKAEYSTSGSYNLNVTKAYLNNGYLNYCDYAGIHPYHETASGQKDFMTQALSLFGAKPVIVSEWGLKPANYTITTYTQAMDANRSFMYSNVRTACYYRFTPGNGWFGLVSSLSSGYTPVEPAYTTYKNWPKASSARIPAQEILEADSRFVGKMYPNPSTGIFRVEVAATDTPVELTVADALGRVVARKQIQPSAGSTSVELSLSGLPDGRYLLQCISGGKRVAQSMLKLK
jgi:hypothetical protein